MPDGPLTPSPDVIPVDVPRVEQVIPVEVPVNPLPPLPRAGVKLAHWILIIIAGFVLVSGVWIAVSEFSYFQWLAHHQNDVDAVIKENGAFREFWLKVFQMVLLNVLLPVLTAILGYTFGSRAQ
jgi:hypothetical protein